jgi:hypothetical protein
MGKDDFPRMWGGKVDFPEVQHKRKSRGPIGFGPWVRRTVQNNTSGWSSSSKHRESSTVRNFALIPKNNFTNGINISSDSRKQRISFFMILPCGYFKMEYVQSRTYLHLYIKKLTIFLGKQSIFFYLLWNLPKNVESNMQPWQGLFYFLHLAPFYTT